MEIVLADTMDKSILESVVDGEGVRLVVFLAGCPHQCIGCHNPDSWDIDNGKKVAVKDLVEYLSAQMPDGYAGITFSGGDPLFQEASLMETVVALRKRLPGINIWCYTGFQYEDVKQLPIIRLLDVLVDGPYMQDRRVPAKRFRGSSNQRILRLVDGAITEEF